MNIKVMKTTLVFFILALAANTTVLASTARYSQTTRSKINSVSDKASSRTIYTGCKSNLKIVLLSSIHRTRKLLTPDEVIIITGPISMTFNGIRTGSIQISKTSSNNLPGIFIPPRTSL
jgi:hypothetical protein